ncbi:hypothetical protein [Pelistega sp. MC2]|uniref:hypothetical protein n=1 Tax=Pelistega sp. MC2 TaxID=1720297 RepID=UPI0008DA7BCE|nr:hypothetical protein [Pelistega sp. MC2]
MSAFLLTYFYLQWTKTEQQLIKSQVEVASLSSQLVRLNQQIASNDEVIEDLLNRNDELLKSFSEKRQTIKKAQQNESVKSWGSQPVPDDIKRVLNR